MDDRQLDRAVERYFDRMLDIFLDEGKERQCKNCRYYYMGVCDLMEDVEPSDADRDPDDTCDSHEFREEDIPDWMEDD